jgi:membrane associated rhomboid family serine protease
MRDRPEFSEGLGLPRPGRALKAVLIGLLLIWLVFAVGINWGGASKELFLLFCGNTQRVLDGQVWRVFTAPLMHLWSTPWHIAGTLLGLYFLAPNLEQAWGTKRFLRFLLVACLIGYALQMLLELLLPAEHAQKLVPLGYWFGAVPALEAVAIAWALSFRGQTVRLMFVLPVSSTGLIVFVVAMSVLYLISAAESPSGLISPFGGMLVGWLLGGGTPSPLRRFWLKVRYARLERESQRAKSARRERVVRSGLRVIEGGSREKPADPADPGSDEHKHGGNGKSGVGPDGRLLN